MNDQLPMLRAIIIEDEWHSQETLRNMIVEFCDGVEVVAISDSISSAVVAINAHAPDLVFLDIEMQDGTGFDLLAKFLTINFAVIFTTAYNEYAVKAFKVNAVDYLLKPIDLDELKLAIEKVKERNSKVNQQLQLESLLNEFKTKKSANQKITIATSEGYEFISIDHIVYCEAKGAYTNFILTDNRKVLVSKHLKEYETALGPFGFHRSHNSFLINTAYVAKYVKSDGGYLVMKNGDTVSISLKRKDALLSLLFSK